MIPSCKFHSPRSSEALSRLHSILHVLPLHHNIHPTQKQRSKHQISLRQMLPGTPVTLAVCLLKYWLKWYMEGPWLFLFLPYWYQNIASGYLLPACDKDSSTLRSYKAWKYAGANVCEWAVTLNYLWVCKFFLCQSRWKKNTEPIGILIIMKKSCATMNCHK